MYAHENCQLLAAKKKGAIAPFTPPLTYVYFTFRCIAYKTVSSLMLQMDLVGLLYCSVTIAMLLVLGIQQHGSVAYQS